MHSLARYHLATKRLAALLGGFVALLAFLYGGLLLGAVAHTAVQTKAERHIKELSYAIGEFEEQYFTSTRAITLGRAQELGFVTPKESTTVFATAASRSLTLESFGSF